MHFYVRTYFNGGGGWDEVSEGGERNRRETTG